MPTLWDAFAVDLPQLEYLDAEELYHDRGSTKFAPFSCTPRTVTFWEGFSALVANASQHPCAQKEVIDVNSVSTAMEAQRAGLIVEEEDITQATKFILLAAFTQSSLNVAFSTSNKYTLSDPNLIAQQTIEQKYLSGVAAENMSAAEAVVRKEQYYKEKSERYSLPARQSPSGSLSF